MGCDSTPHAASDLLTSSFPPGAPSDCAGARASGSGRAGASAAGGEPRRGPGRPAKASGKYSKGYLRIKQWRQRTKQNAETLVAEVEQKMSQLSVLSAENDMLKIRESVLQQCILARKPGDAGAAAPAGSGSTLGGGGGGGCPPAAGRDGSGTSSSASSAISADTAAAATAAASSAEAGPAAAPAAAAAAAAADPGSGVPQARSLNYHTVVEMVRRMHARVKERAAAVAAGLPPPRPWFGEDSGVFPGHHTLLRVFMLLTPTEMHALLCTNMETSCISNLPPGIWQQVAEGITLSPEQEQRTRAAFEAFPKRLEEVMRERRGLQQRLALAMRQSPGEGAPAAAPGGGGGAPAPASGGRAVVVKLEKGCSEAGGGGAVAGGYGGLAGEILGVTADRQELVEALKANMLREDQVYTTMSWTLKSILEPEPLATCILLSWPFWPRLAFVMAAKLGIKVSPPSQQPQPLLPHQQAQQQQ